MNSAHFGAGCRTLCVLLASLLLLGSIERARAPIPIGLALALKCIGIGTLGATAVIIFRCEPNYYLIRVRADGEPDHWLVSQASDATVAKNEGWLRCEGPFKDRSEPDFRAWINNQDPSRPMFPCGPLGTIPGPTYTNYNILVTLQTSADGGAHWANAATAITSHPDDNWSFACLPATGTNGMTRAQLLQVAGCTTILTNTDPALVFRVFGAAIETSQTQP
jgi:hypothetical protein